eukprot:gene13582-18231_t
MFEQGLSYLLRKLLTDFVEEGSSNSLQENIQIGVWSGLIVLENLVLKPSLFKELQLSLAFGFIGRLEIRIPWGSLGIDPVMIIIDKVYMVIKPKYEWNPGAAERRDQAIKQAKLAAAELFASSRQTTKDSTPSYGDYAMKWMVNSLLSKLVSNIDINIRSVHIRYEDVISCPSAFCIGFSFESLHIQTRDSPFIFEDETVNSNNYDMKNDSNNLKYSHYKIDTNGSPIFHKHIQLNQCTIYWNPLLETGTDLCSRSFIGRPQKDILAFMAKTTATRLNKYADRPRHHYILRPTDISIYLDISFNSSTGMVKAGVKLIISDLSILLEDRQFREMISLASNMTNFAKLEKHSEFRPKSVVHVDPAAWWRYAINSIIAEKRVEKLKRLTGRQRAEDNLVYGELWKSKLCSAQGVIIQFNNMKVDHLSDRLDRKASLYLTILKNARSVANERRMNHSNLQANDNSSYEKIKSLQIDTMKLLHQLEYELSFEDIIYFRSNAEQHLSISTKQNSWISELYSWVSGGKNANATVDDNKIFLNAIQYDHDRVLRAGALYIDPKEVISIITVHIKSTSVCVALSPIENTNSNLSIPFFSLEFNGLKTNTIVLGDGSNLLIGLTLQSMDAFEVLPVSEDQKILSSQQEEKDVLRKNELGFENMTFINIIRRGAINNNTQERMHNFWNSETINAKMDAISSNNSVVSGYSTDDNVTAKQYIKSTSSIHSISSMKRKKDRTISDIPLLSCSIEICPQKKNSETIVKMSMESLIVNISPYAKWIDSLALFFAWPEDLKYWSEMEMTALNQFADIKAQLDAKIDYMMNNHVNVIVDAFIRAPLIVISSRQSIPTNASKRVEEKTKVEEDDLLVIDLGIIIFKTERLAKAYQEFLQEELRSNSAYASDATPNSNNLLVNNEGMFMVQTPRTGTKKWSDDDYLSETAEAKEYNADESFTSHFDQLSNQNSVYNSPHNRSEVLEVEIGPLSPNEMKSQQSPYKSLSVAPNNEELKLLALTNHLIDGAIKGIDSVVPIKLNAVSDYHRDENLSKLPSISGHYITRNIPANDDNQSYLNDNERSNAFKQNKESELFDVYTLQIAEMEVFLVNSEVFWNSYDRSDDDTSLKFHNKISIVEKFEIAVEVRVSTLPWDTSLPPVKLNVEIPEIRTNLSPEKIIRLQIFGINLVSGSLKVIKTNKKLLEKVKKAMQNSSHMPTAINNADNSKKGSLKPIKSFKAKCRTSENESLVSSNPEYKSSNGFESSNQTSHQVNVGDDSYKRSSLRSRSFDRSSQKGSRSRYIENKDKQLPSASSMMSDADYETVNNYTNDDDSFFSFEDTGTIDGLDRSKQIEQLRNLISQKEIIITQTVSEIRFNEADPMKSETTASLRRSLELHEKELKRCKETYVELLMIAATTSLDHNDIRPENNKFDNTNVSSLLNVDELFSQLLNTIPARNEDDENIVKRNMIHSSIFKIHKQANGTNQISSDQCQTNNINKELLFLKVNIAQINVDLECMDYSNSNGNKKQNAFDPKSKTNGSKKMILRLRLISLGMKVRHRTLESKINVDLRELDVEDATNYALNHHNLGIAGRKSNMAGNSIPLVSSDPSIFDIFSMPLCGKYQPNNSTELLKIGYEVIFNNSMKINDDTLNSTEEFQPVNTESNAIHNLRCQLGFLGVNIDQDRLHLIVQTLAKISSDLTGLILSNNNSTSNDSLPTDSSATTPAKFFPTIILSGKVD